MATCRVIVSSSSAKRLQAASERVRLFSGRTEVLVLAGNRGAADDFVRECARAAGGFYGVHRLTLRQLAAVLAAHPMAEHRLAPVSRLGMEAIAARSIYSCRAERQLEYFEPVADTPGFPRALAATLAELRSHGVDAVRLAATGPPGRDLARLLERYERELSERSLADFTILFELAAEVAFRADHRLTGLPLFLLDCPIHSEIETKFLAALATASPEVFATAPADDPGVTLLEGVLAVKAESLDTKDPQGTLERLQRYVFSQRIPSAAAIDQSLDFFSAAGEGLESVEIARRIRLLAAEGVPFDHMAILLRNPDDYLPLLADALRRAGIPGHFTRSAARPDRAGRALLALLACAAEGLTASRFAEYLSLGQAASIAPVRDWVAPQDDALPQLKAPPAPDGQGSGEPTDTEDERSPNLSGSLRTPFDWEKLLVDAAVIGGADRWSRRLRGLDAEYRLQLQALDKEGDPRRQHLEKQIELLENLQRFALPLIEFLAALPKKAIWKDWLEQLSELARMALRRPDSVLSVLNELQPMDQVGPVELDEVRSVLTECLSFLRPDPPGRRYGHVFVGAIEEAHGRSFEVVFLPGLAEGLFPRKASEDPLLLDESRRKLAAGLPLQDDRVARERLLLRLAAGAACSRLIVSYPRMDVTIGRPRVPSFYLLEIWRAAEGRLPDLREMEKRAGQAASSQLGWPAPQDPAQAIDDGEYDLAFLNQLIHRPPERAKGSARYLIEANQHLARSLRTRWQRWQTRSWTVADGIVDPDQGSIEILASHSVRNRSYSPTALQQYACCPYRFLLYAILGLRPREEPEAIQQLDPLTRGALFHDVQFELFRELDGAGLLPVRQDNVSQVLDVADRVLNRVTTRYEEDLAPAIPRVWKSGVEEIRIDLRTWILESVSIHAEWQPAHFELAFGLRDGRPRDPKSSSAEAIILDGVRLRGSIDLVEKHRSGGVLRVTDHKTGKPPAMAPRWVGNGEILQPVLYGLAAETLLGTKVESGLLFYATQRGNYTRHEIQLTPDARRRAAYVIETIDSAVREGFLPAAPKPDGCAYCDYRSVCGPYEERRVKKKKQDRLEPLEALRSMP